MDISITLEYFQRWIFFTKFGYSTEAEDTAVTQKTTETAARENRHKTQETAEETEQFV